MSLLNPPQYTLPPGMIVLALSQIQLYPRTGLGQWGSWDAYRTAAKHMGNQREARKKQGADSDEFKRRHPSLCARTLSSSFANPSPTLAHPGFASIDPLGAYGEARVETVSQAGKLLICAILQRFDMFLRRFGAGRRLT